MANTQPRLFSPKGYLMRQGTLLKIAVSCFSVLFCLASASAQQVRFFPDFSSVNYLQMNGAHQASYNGQYVLRMTDGYPAAGAPHPESATTWFTIQQPLNAGFTTYFRFQIHGANICCSPGDGLAFVVQNAASTDSSYGAAGAGLTARGVSGGGLGYAGIPNSLAVEFDTLADAWDPTSNHVAVQGCGTATNGPVHNPGTYTIYHNNNVTSCLVGSLTGSGAGINSAIPHLGVTCGTSSCADGIPHDVVIEYTPPAIVNGNGTLMVWIDPQFIPGTHTPVKTAVPAINIPYNIDHTYNSKGISLGGGTSAWVGFTASQNSQPQQQDILAWEFTPHTPTYVQQVIPPGGTDAHFTFGGHDTVVNYFPAFANDPNDPYLMTVVATPTARNVFYQSRLKGTPFYNQQCVVYLGTGGNCIVYSITCQRQSNPNVSVPCPTSVNPCDNSNQAGCIQFSTSFYTSDGITAQNANYLKADPIGTNNWVSIFLSYDPNTFDGQTTGRGHDTSDFVATFFLGSISPGVQLSSAH
jgi:Bacterial lectin